jgi:DNA polymerase-3 subunit beta
MKLKLTKKPFLSALRKIQGVTEKNPIVPSTSNVLIEAKNEFIVLEATNFEVGIIVKCNATVNKTGRVVVDARKIYEIIKELPEGAISVEKKDTGWLEIKQKEKIVFNLAGQTEEDFKKVEIEEGIKLYEIGARGVGELIRKTVYATSGDRTREALRGVLMEKEGDVLRMVATDGHRMALAEKRVLGGEGIETAGKVILPERGAKEIRDLSEEKGDGKIEIGIGEKSVVVRGEGETLMVRLIDGEFPDYKKVIPQKNDKRITIKTGEITESLKRVTLLAEEETREIIVNVKENKMVVSSRKTGQGEAREEREVEYEGEEVEFGVNSRYIIDALSALGGEKATIEVSDGKTPILLREEGTEKTIAVIMPMIL